jgi:hypothetical protein
VRVSPDGDVAALWGFGSPSVNGGVGYTWQVGQVAPLVTPVCTTAINPQYAVPIGDGLYMEDPLAGLGIQP